MKRLTVLLVLLGAAPASAGQLMVVGRTGTLYEPRAVKAGPARVKVSGRRCAVAARTPLAALLDSRLKVALRDYGACGKRAAAASGLYVRGVAGERAQGADGWVYKRGHRAPPSGAADLASRTRGRILWFWCRMGKAGCQRTLETTALADVGTAGQDLDVRVRAYDDQGKGVPAAGSTVTVGHDAAAVADADGIAHVRLGAETGTLGVVATQPGRIRSFVEKVEVL